MVVHVCGNVDSSIPFTANLVSSVVIFSWSEKMSFNRTTKVGTKPLLHILMVSPQFYPMVGGYERQAQRLSAALVKRGLAVTVVAERRQKTWARYELIDMVPVERLNCIYKPKLHTISAATALGTYLWRNRHTYNVVHVHQYGWPAGIAVLVSNFAGRPVVLKVTNTGAWGVLARTSRTVEKHVLRPLLRRIDAWVATSQQGARELQEFGVPSDRVWMIPNGIDTAEYAPACESERMRIRRSFDLDYQPVCLFVGRLDPQKNVTGLITAWRSVVQAIPDSRLLIAGHGSQSSLIAAMVEDLGLSESVRLLGYIEAPLRLYQAADVFVLPSLHEGLSNALLEAMACGLPVVGTRVSGTEDLLADGKCGHLVEPGDEAALAQAIIDLLTHSKERLRKSIEARSRIEAEYSIESVADRYVNLYSRLVGSQKLR